MLLTISDFQKAIEYQLDVEVTQDGTHIGFGKITFHSKEAVRIQNDYYIKEVCEFRIVTVLH